MQTDFLVIGSGIAGLTYALKVAQECPDQQVTILTKAQSDETNTKYAQGGIAGVMDFDNDSFSKHIEDTLIAGDGLCNREVVEIVVKEGVERITLAVFYSPDNHTVVKSNSVLTEDARYKLSQAKDGSITYGDWEKLSYERYRAK